MVDGLSSETTRLATVVSMDEPKRLPLHPALRRIGLLGKRCLLAAAALAVAGRRWFVHDQQFSYRPRWPRGRPARTRTRSLAARGGLRGGELPQTTTDLADLAPQDPVTREKGVLRAAEPFLHEIGDGQLDRVRVHRGVRAPLAL